MKLCVVLSCDVVFLYFSEKVVGGFLFRCYHGKPSVLFFIFFFLFGYIRSSSALSCRFEHHKVQSSDDAQ